MFPGPLGELNAQSARDQQRSFVLASSFRLYFLRLRLRLRFRLHFSV